MQTSVLRLNPQDFDPQALQTAGEILRSGGLVVFPTETVYGVAADATNADAVAHLRGAKGRPETKPLPLMITGEEDIRAFARETTPLAYELAHAFWPGPLTLVVEASERVGEWIHAGTHRVGLRAPDHPVAQGVLRAAGRPLALSSANLSDSPDAVTADQALIALGGRVDLVVDAGPARMGSPSTVIDLTAQPPCILRPGQISKADLELYLSVGL